MRDPVNWPATHFGCPAPRTLAIMLGCGRMAEDSADVAFRAAEPAVAGKSATATFRWLQQIAMDHGDLRKIAMTMAIRLCRYLDRDGPAYLDQCREGGAIGVTDRHIRTALSSLVERGHLIELGRTKAHNVRYAIVIKPEHTVPVEHSVPVEAEH